MLRSTEDRVALIKIESSYGTDSAPGAGNAVLLMNSTVTPVAEKLERALDSPFFGSDPFVNVGKHITLSGEVDLLGASTPGTASPYSVLYRACGHSETLVAAPLSAPANLAVANSTTGGTLADATYSYRVSAVNACGETVPATAATDTATGGGTSSMVLTWDPVVGATHYRIYGRDSGTELLLAETTATTWTDTGALTPTGAIPATNTTVGTIYAPISKNFASATVYFYWAGILFKLTGVRGYLDPSMAIKTFAKAKVELTGILAVPADGEAPGGIDWSAFQAPAAIETETWEVKFGTYNVCAQSLDMTCNSEVKLQECSESREVTISDRKPTGTIRVFKDAALSVWNPWAVADTHAITTLRSTIEKTSGINVVLTVRAQIEYPKPVDLDGNLGYEIPYAAIPSGAGGDEYTIAFR